MDMIETIRGRIRLLRSLLPAGQTLSSVTVSRDELRALMSDVKVIQFIDIDPTEPKTLKLEDVRIVVE